MSFLRFAFSELLHSKRFAILFLVNLSFGLTSFSALEFLKNSIQTTIMSQSRQVLGADFGISSRHALNEQEQFIVQKNLPQQALATDVIETFSMVTHGQSSALVQIKAVQLTFPFYGQILTEPLKKTSYLEDTESVWIYPELLTLLNARIGDFLKIGTRQFRIAAVVKDDTASNISTNMAPRIYMSLNSLKKTNLVRSGSLAWYSTLYKIPNFSEEQLDSLKNQIYQQLSDNEVQVFTHRSASEQMNRLLNYLSDFLGLISLSSLFIACIGLTFLLSTYLHDKSVSIAILNVLGYSKKKAILFYALQLFAVTLFGAIISVFLAIVSLPFLLQASQTVAAFTILLNVNFTTLFQILLAGTLGGFCIILPHLIHLIYSPPRQLLSNMPRTHKNIYWQLLLAYIPGALLFYLLSIREMHSVQNGSIFFACFVGSGLLLYGFSYFILSLAQKIKWAPSLAFAWALRDLTRLRISTTTGFLSLALGVFLVNIIPQIRANLQGEIQKPITSKLPSLFLFDIQEEQLNDIQKILKNEHIHLQHLSPLIRARLLEVNGTPFEKGTGAFSSYSTREQENESRFRNRGFNLSYRPELDASETISQGSAPPRHFDDKTATLPEISLEERFANRLHLKIGDILTFDIQDIPIKGKVTSLRHVKWTSFQPNFFVLFQDGSLDDAPKTFLATIAKLELNQKLNLQKKIVQALPNISIIDVDRLIEKLVFLIDQMGWALQAMSLFCILVGFTVLLAIANDQIRRREWDIGLLKALGSSYKTITACFVYQFTIIGFFAALAGGLLSILGSYIFSTFLFDGAWFFNWQVPALSVLGLTLLCPLLTFIGTRKGLAFKAKELLSQR